MNGSSAYGSVLNVAPAQQSVNNAPNRVVANDHSAQNFQQTMKDIRADQDEESKAQMRAKTASSDRSQKQSRSHTAAAKNTANIENSAANKRASQRADNLQEANEKSRQANDKMQLASEKLRQASAKEKLDSETSREEANREEINREKKQKCAEQSVSESAANVIIPGVATAEQTTAAVTDGDGIKSSAENPEGLKNSAFKSQLELSNDIKSLNNAEKSSTAIDNANTNSSVLTNGFNVNYQENPAANAEATSTLVAPTIAASAAIQAEVVGMKATSDTAPLGAFKNTTVSDTAKSDASLTSDTAQVSGADIDSNNQFEKMLQSMTSHTKANAAEQALGDSGNKSTTTANTNISSAAPDAFGRSADSLAPATRSFVVQAAIPVTVGQPQWSQAVGEKVLWLAAQNVTAAEIRLDPPDLGPMHIKVSVNQDQASVSFTSHHAGVREVLDQSLTRLRDMFSEQGLNLVNVDVSDRSFHRQQGEAKGQQGQGGTAELVEDETLVRVSAIIQQRLVDHYA